MINVYLPIAFEIFNAVLRPINWVCIAIFCIPTPIALIQLYNFHRSIIDRMIFFDLLLKFNFLFSRFIDMKTLILH